MTVQWEVVLSLRTLEYCGVGQRGSCKYHIASTVQQALTTALMNLTLLTCTRQNCKTPPSQWCCSKISLLSRRPSVSETIGPCWILSGSFISRGRQTLQRSWRHLIRWPRTRSTWIVLPQKCTKSTTSQPFEWHPVESHRASTNSSSQGANQPDVWGQQLSCNGPKESQWLGTSLYQSTPTPNHTISNTSGAVGQKAAQNKSDN